MESKKIYMWLTIFLVVIVGITGVFIFVSGRNGGDIIDIGEGPIVLGSYFGEDEKIFYINTVGEIHEYEFEVDTVIRALGLLSPDDGLMSEYKVISDSDGYIDDYTRIALPNGNTAVLKESQTHVAYIGQFGAVGDGYIDDTKAISSALNSDYTTVVFTPGNYRANSYITVTVGMKTVIGVEGSVIFTDEQYNSTKEFFITLGADNIIFDGMTIETRAPSVNKYKSQLAIKDAMSIAIDNSSFHIFPVDGFVQERAPRHYLCIDLYTGWENIRVDNCTLTNMTNGTAGGIIAMRDIGSRGGRGAQITNNILTKRSHDEIIWIFGEQVELSDILISDNIITMEESTSPSPITFTFSSTNSIIRNIEFTRNTVVACSTYNLFNVINAHDVLIADNNIHYTNVGTGNNLAFYSGAATGSGTNTNVGSSLETRNLIVENNNITFDTPNASTSRVFCIKGIVRNNTVTVNGNLYAVAEGDVPLICDNEIIVNGDVTQAIVRNTPRVMNNIFTINGEAARVIRYYGVNLADDVSFEDNRVFIRDGNASNSECLLSISDTTFNDNSLYVLSNEIICGSDDYRSFLEGRLPGVATAATRLWTGNAIDATAVSKNRLLYSASTIKDKNPQSIIFGSNSFFGYQKTYAEKTASTNNTAGNIEALQQKSHQPDEAFIATITDAAGNALQSLEASPYVFNVVWSNNTGTDVD